MRPHLGQRRRLPKTNRSRTVKSFGSLAAFDQATLSTKVAGRIESMAVDLGAIVRKGDIIAQIDERDFKLQVQQAEAMLQGVRDSERLEHMAVRIP